MKIYLEFYAMKSIIAVLLMSILFIGCEKDEKRNYTVKVQRSSNVEVKVIVDGIGTEFFNSSGGYTKEFSFPVGRLIQIDASYVSNTGSGLTMTLYRGSEALETKTGDKSVSIKFTDQ